MKRITIILLLLLILFDLSSVFGSKAIAKRTKEFTVLKYDPLEFVSGSLPDFELFVVRKDKNIDFSARKSSRVRLRMDGNALTTNSLYPNSLKLEFYTYDQNQEKIPISTVRPSAYNKLHSKNLEFVANLGYFSTDYKIIYVDLYSRYDHLLNTYRFEVNANNITEQNEPAPTSTITEANCPTDKFGECQLDYILNNLSFEAMPRVNIFTEVRKQSDGKYLVTIPIARKRVNILSGMNVKSRTTRTGGGTSSENNGDLNTRLNLGISNDFKSTFEYYPSEDKLGLKFARQVNNTDVLTITSDGRVGINKSNPEAVLDINGANSTRPALKLNSGSLVSNPVDGSFEYDGSKLYFTENGSRYSVMLGKNGYGKVAKNDVSADFVFVNDAQIVANKTLSNTILTGSIWIPANAQTNYVLTSDASGYASWQDAATIVSPGSSFVTLTGTETLTNKTLTAPTISSPSITGTLTYADGNEGTNKVLVSDNTGGASWQNLASIINNNAWIDDLRDGISDKNTDVYLGNGSGLNDSGTSSQYNTAVGVDSLRKITTGDSNIAIGYKALFNGTIGSNNIAIGDKAANNLISGSNNIHIGLGSLASSTSISNELNIGNTIFGNTSTHQLQLSNATPQPFESSNVILEIGDGTVNNINSANSVLIKGDLEVDDDVFANNLTSSSTITGTNLDISGNVKFTSGAGANKILMSDASGNATWTNSSALSTSAGGSTTEIQFNNSGSFDGNANFTINDGTNTVSIGSSGILDIDGNLSIADTTITLDGASTTFTQSNGAIIMNPNTGNNFAVNLSGAGDFAVNTNQLFVDTSAARVGIGTTSPGSELRVIGKTWTDNFRLGSSTTAGYILTADLGGNGTWQAAPSGADNLGNHTATQALDMNSFSLKNAAQINGSTLNISGNVNSSKILASANINGSTLNISGTANSNKVLASANINGASLNISSAIKFTGGSPGAGKVLTSDGSGNATWQSPGSGADNLGNHTATQALDMNSFSLKNAAQINGSTLNISGNVNSNKVLATANINGATANISGDVNSSKILASANINGASLNISSAFKFTDGNQGSGKILTSDGSGNATWQAAPSGADDLGSHIAIHFLDMNSHSITNAAQINGVTLNISGTANSNKVLASANINGATLNISGTTNSNKVLASANINGATLNISGTANSNKVLASANINGATLNISSAINFTGGSPGAGKVLTSDGSGNATWQSPGAGADNLGNHIAIQALNMSSESITNAAQINGVTLNISGTANSNKVLASANINGATLNISGTANSNKVLASANINGATLNISGTANSNKVLASANINGATLNISSAINFTGGSPGAGKVLTSDGSGNATWQSPGAGADNLGNHIAIQALNMSSESITNAAQINGVTLNISGTANSNKVLASANINGATLNISGTANSNKVLASANINGATLNISGTANSNKVLASANINGATLNISSAFKFTDGNQGSGKILSSDASGNASWISQSSINAGSLGGFGPSEFLKSNTTNNFTSGVLITNSGTRFDVNGDLSIADIDISLDGASTTFTQNNGAITMNPKAGSNLNVSLSGAGDFAVNTNQLYVDTSAAKVGIGTTSPGSELRVIGKTWTDNFRLGSSTTAGYILTADLGGNGTWISPSSLTTSAGGSTTEIQFNNSGSFDGNANFTINDGANTVSIGSSGILDIDGNLSIADIDITLDGASTTFTQNAGPITMNPNAGSNFAVNLSGAGDFAVNTNQLYVDTSAANVGIGTTTPSTFKLEVAGNLGPSATNTYDLGSSGRYWNNLYVKTLSVSSGGITSIGSISTSGNISASGSISGGSISTSGNITTGLTSGSAVFVGSSGVLSQDNSNFYWDDTNNRLGLGTASPSTPLHVSGTARATNFNGTNLTLSSGSLRLPVTSVSSNTTLNDTHYAVLVNASGGAITITLPAANSFNTGLTYVIKKTDSSANTVTVQGSSANIDGSASQLLILQYESMTLECDGTNWHIL